MGQTAVAPPNMTQLTLTMIPIEVQPYKPDPKKWVVKPLDKFLGKMQDKSLVYEMGVTPQMPDEPEWCIFMVTVIKEAINSRFGKVLECHVTSGFKIKATGKSLTPEFLYPLLVIAYDTFKKIYDEKNKGTHVAHYIMNKPEYADYEKYLDIAIMGVGTSKQ